MSYHSRNERQGERERSFIKCREFCRRLCQHLHATRHMEGKRVNKDAVRRTRAAKETKKARKRYQLQKRLDAKILLECALELCPRFDTCSSSLSPENHKRCTAVLIVIVRPAFVLFVAATAIKLCAVYREENPNGYRCHHEKCLCMGGWSCLEHGLA